MTAEERAALLADLHTTAMGEERIRRNAAPDADDVITWCRERIAAPDVVMERRGKNIYITSHGSKALQQLLASERFETKSSSFLEDMKS